MKKIFTIIVIAFFVFNTSFSSAKTKTNMPANISNLESKWLFDSSEGPAVPDSSGNNITALLQSGAKLASGGLSGSTALSLDGASQYASNNSPIPRIGNTGHPYTLSAWVNMSAVDANGNILNIASNSNDTGWCLPMVQIASGQFQINSWSGSVGTVSVVSNRDIKKDTWYNIVEVWNPADSGHELKMYINGNLEGSSSLPDYAGAGSSAYLFVGHDNGGCSNNAGSFGGLVDDVRTYSKALSPGQAQEIFSGRVSVTTPAPTKDVFGYWPLDSFDDSNITKDKSINHRNGLIVGTLSSVVAGKLGKALSFDGNNYIELGNTGSISFSTLTVSLWFKASTLTTGGNPRLVANSHTDENNIGFQLAFDDGGQVGFFDVGNGSAEGRASWSSNLVADTWYHYVGTYDGSFVRAYINGAEVASAAFSGGDIAASSNPINIARNPFYDGDYFQGSIDDTRIYNRALSAAEVSTMYKTRKTIVNNITDGKTIDHNLIGYWPLDGKYVSWLSGSDSNFIDKSSSNNGAGSNLLRSTSPVRGPVGQAINFNGASSCITTSVSLLSDKSAFSIAGWIYPRTWASGQGFFGQNDTIEFGMGGSPNTIAGWTQPGGSVSWSFDPTFLNKWHHVSFEGTGSEERLYVDGERVVTSSGSVLNYGNSPDGFNIGGCGIWDGFGNYFNGKIDDVRVYDKALSDNEVKQLYLLGK